MDLIDIRRGDKDTLGDVIDDIFYKKTNTDNKVDYLIYEISEGQMRFDAKEIFAKKLVNYSSSIVDIQSSLTINPELRKRYNPYLANLIRSVFESEEDVDLKSLFIKLNDNIVGNILSIARLKYLRQCLYYLLIVIGVILMLWLYNSTISGTYFFKSFSEDFIQMFYLASAGAVGGFISVTLKINRILIDPFIPFKRTKLDADVRIILAMIFGILIFWFLKSEFISFIDATKLNFDRTTGTLLSLSIAVVSGFSVRLIPNILVAKEKEFITAIPVKKPIKQEKEKTNNPFPIIEEMSNKNPESGASITQGIEDLFKTQPSKYSIPIIKSKYTIVQIFGGDDPTLIGQTKKNVLEYISGLSGDITLIGLCDFYENGAKIIKYHPEQGKNISIDEIIIKDLGEINSSDSNILKEFITKALSSCKQSDLVALGFYGHGSGVLNEKGINHYIERTNQLTNVTNFSNFESIFGIDNLIIGEDASTNNATIKTGLTNEAAREIISYALTESKFNRKLNLLFFDSCLNGSIEVITQFKDFSDYIVSSESTEFIAGWNYDTWGKLMSITPPKNSKQWAIQAVQAYRMSSMKRKKQRNITISAIDTSGIDNLTDMFKNFISRIQDLGIKGFKALDEVFLNETESYEDQIYDLGHMIENIKQKNVDSNLNSICDRVIAALEKVVLLNIAEGNDVKNAKGLSIFFPRRIISAMLINETYKNLLFEEKTEWLNFIIKLKKELKTP